MLYIEILLQTFWRKSETRVIKLHRLITEN